MSNTEFGDKVLQAIKESEGKMENFVWKGPRSGDKKTQETIRMIDATPEQLQSWYDHCKSMLYSTDKKCPGRYVLQDIVAEQRAKCNTELYLRWLENKYQKDMPEPRNPYPRFLYLSDIQTYLRHNEDTIKKEDYDKTPIRNNVTLGVPYEFRDVTIADTISGCIDTLGIFSREHISLKFITKLGVWLTDKEMQELTELDENGNVRNRIDVIKERHNLKPVIKLKSNSRGLKYSELRAMLNLRNKKYSELTTEQLLVLRDKVLYRFENEIDFHIDQWKTIMEQLEQVAESKGIELK